MTVKVDCEIAMALGHDAANRQAESQERSAWNEDDWNPACEVFDKAMDNSVIPFPLTCRTIESIDLRASAGP